MPSWIRRVGKESVAFNELQQRESKGCCCSNMYSNKPPFTGISPPATIIFPVLTVVTGKMLFTYP
jgi:hypothetical protein